MKIKLKSANKLLTALGLFLLSVTIGMTGFSLIEHFNPIDAFYMAIITIGAVGFTEVHEFSTDGRLFTAFYIIFNLGIYAYVIYVITTYVFQGELGRLFNSILNRNKINKMENHVIICGYGRNGFKAASELLKRNYKIVTLEKNNTLFKERQIHKPENIIVLEGDATQDDLLIQAGIRKAAAIITTLPNDADNVLITLTARELNNHIKIIARAMDTGSEKKLKRAGANYIVMPEFIGGVHMARLLTNPEMISFLNIAGEDSKARLRLDEIVIEKLPVRFHDKSISELDMDNKIMIVGYKNQNGHFIFNPDHNIKMHPKDILFLLGTHEKLEVFNKTYLSESLELF